MTADPSNKYQTRIFVSLESDQSTRYWIPISAIPTWQEFVAVLASIFHNDSPPTLYYVSDRRNVIHESVWQYREYLTQNGIFHVEFGGQNEVAASEIPRQTTVAVQDEQGPVTRAGPVVLDDSGQPLSLPPPPPYSPGPIRDIVPRQAGIASAGVVNDASSSAPPHQIVARAAHDTANTSLSFALPFLSIFSLHLLIQTPHNLSPSNGTPNFTFSQHLIVNPSVAVSHIREIARRLFVKKHPSVTRRRTTFTLVHKRFGPGRRIFPIRFDEMLDGKNLGQYGCVDEDSKVEVSVRIEQDGTTPSPTLSERAADWIRQIRDPTGLHSDRAEDNRRERQQEDEMDVDEPEDDVEDIERIVHCSASGCDCASDEYRWRQNFAMLTDSSVSAQVQPVVMSEEDGQGEEVL